MSAKMRFITAMLIFSTIALVVKNVEYSASVIVLARCVIGALFLMGFFGVTRRSPDWQAIKENGRWLLLSGIGLGLNWLFLFEAFKHTTVSVSILCYYLAPVIALLSAPIFLKETITRQQVLCILVALLGMFFVSGAYSGEIVGVTGIVFALLAALFYASVIVINRKIKNISPYDVSMIQLLCAAIIFVFYVPMTQDLSAITWSSEAALLLLIAGTVHTGIAYLLYFSSFSSLSTQSISVLSYLDPVMSVVFAWLILNEPLTISSMIGGALILGATFAMEFCGKNEKIND